MNNFYEYFRDKENELYYKIDNNPVYPPHFHAGIEVFILKKGFFTLTINGAQINLTAGSIAVVDSYEIHSYDFKAKLEENSAVLLIPYEFRRFLVPDSNKKITCPVIKNGSLAGEVMELITKYLCEDGKVQSGALTLILSLISNHLCFSQENEKDEITLIRKILNFIQLNYRGDASRGKIASSLGYTESYVSHVFHRYIKMGINKYVNRLRLLYVKEKLACGEKKTINEIIFEAGFKSQQTYYRVKSLYGLPSENSLWKYR